MSEIEAQLERARTLRSGERMSDERLTEVFNLVKDPENWKMPIEAVVDRREATDEEIIIAVTWFAGGGCEVAGSEAHWHVYAPGYYEEIGS